MEQTSADFGLLPWQRQPWDLLRKALSMGRMPHGLLLMGLPGLGKKQFALCLAQGLLCDTPNRLGFPCGTCRACHMFSAGSHPDFQLITPEEGSKSGDIRVDAIRVLTERGMLTSASGGYKVILINPADRMNTAAANSLLKTLEEPAERTLLLLISAVPARMPATIRSRCQMLKFAVPKRATAINWLRQRAEQQDPELLLDISGGAPLTALALAQSPMLAERDQLLREFLGVGDKREDPVQIAERWITLDLPAILNWLVGWLIDLRRLQTQASSVQLFNPDFRAELGTVVPRLDAAELHKMLNQAYRAKEALDTNLSPQLVLEKLLIRWSRVVQNCKAIG